jgi:hypothetical protein
MSGTLAVEEHNQCVTHESSSCSSDNRTTTITIRIPLWLLQRLKEKGVSNISKFARKLMLQEVEGELTKEEEIEYQLDVLREEMTKLHNYHKTLLAHGSYAKDYLEKLKDGNVVTHKPFSYSKSQNLTLSREELELVEETVKLREKLSNQYCEKLKELLKLKKKDMDSFQLM